MITPWAFKCHPHPVIYDVLGASWVDQYLNHDAATLTDKFISIADCKDDSLRLLFHLLLFSFLFWNSPNSMWRSINYLFRICWRTPGGAFCADRFVFKTIWIMPFPPTTSALDTIRVQLKSVYIRWSHWWDTCSRSSRVSSSGHMTSLVFDWLMGRNNLENVSQLKILLLEKFLLQKIFRSIDSWCFGAQYSSNLSKATLNGSIFSASSSTSASGIDRKTSWISGPALASSKYFNFVLFVSPLVATT